METPFEKVDKYTDRLKVPNGWLVRTMPAKGWRRVGFDAHMLFLKDEFHDWELEAEGCKSMCPVYDKGNCIRATCTLPYKTGE